MTFWKWVFFGVFSTLLVACGGGGSSSQSTITSVTTVPEFAVIKDDGIKSNFINFIRRCIIYSKFNYNYFLKNNPFIFLNWRILFINLFVL